MSIVIDLIGKSQHFKTFLMKPGQLKNYITVFNDSLMLQYCTFGDTSTFLLSVNI